MLQSPIARFLQSDAGEFIQTFGILLTVLISVIVLALSIRSMKRRNYVNQITSLKAKYIEDLRQHIAEYLSMAMECNKAIFIEHYKTGTEKHQLIKELERKYMFITLFLDNKNPIDRKLTDYIQEIRLAAITKRSNGWEIEAAIEQLVNYGQQVLLLEWNNLKREARTGYQDTYEVRNTREEFMLANVDL
jgi:tRNA/tmRNA/rRNA uracil-C5-methylase (TrmA/RlmC/RlmD family)